MAAVKAFAVPGVRMFFPGGDHEPPHFHARKGRDWAVKVYILEARPRMMENTQTPRKRMTGSDRRAIVDGVETY